MNPWMSIWFRTRNTIAWLRDNRPLYGVVAIVVVLYVLDVLKASLGTAPAVTGPDSAGNPVMAVVNAVLFPILSVALIYGVSRYFKTRATLGNVVSVTVWSLLPVIVLSALTLPLIVAAISFGPPVLTNDISVVCGVVTISPPEPQINAAALAYSIMSTAFYLWSFQILLTGMSEVMGVRMKRALWILTLAMIAMMLVQIPMSLLFGDFSILDFLGFSEFVDAPEQFSNENCQ